MFKLDHLYILVCKTYSIKRVKSQIFPSMINGSKQLDETKMGEWIETKKKGPKATNGDNQQNKSNKKKSRRFSHGALFFQ